MDGGVPVLRSESISTDLRLTGRGADQGGQNDIAAVRDGEQCDPGCSQDRALSDGLLLSVACSANRLLSNNIDIFIPDEQARQTALLKALATRERSPQDELLFHALSKHCVNELNTLEWCVTNEDATVASLGVTTRLLTGYLNAAIVELR